MKKILNKLHIIWLDKPYLVVLSVLLIIGFLLKTGSTTTSNYGASSSMGGVGGLLLLAIYFIPTIIATRKKHIDKNSIILLNVLAGWTIIGWIVSLIWATRTTQKNEFSMATEIEKLHMLKEKGIISEEQFNTNKQKLI